MFVKQNSEVDQKPIQPKQFKPIQTKQDPNIHSLNHPQLKKVKHCRFWQKPVQHWWNESSTSKLTNIPDCSSCTAKLIPLVNLQRWGGKFFKFYGINYHRLSTKSRSTSSFLHSNSLINNSVWSKGSNFMHCKIS